MMKMMKYIILKSNKIQQKVKKNIMTICWLYNFNNNITKNNKVNKKNINKHIQNLKKFNKKYNKMNNLWNKNKRKNLVFLKNLMQQKKSF